MRKKQFKPSLELMKKIETNRETIVNLFREIVKAQVRQWDWALVVEETLGVEIDLQAVTQSYALVCDTVDGADRIADTDAVIRAITSAITRDLNEV